MWAGPPGALRGITLAVHITAVFERWTSKQRRLANACLHAGYFSLSVGFCVCCHLDCSVSMWNAAAPRRCESLTLGLSGCIRNSPGLLSGLDPELEDTIFPLALLSLMRSKEGWRPRGPWLGGQWIMVWGYQLRTPSGVRRIVNWFVITGLENGSCSSVQRQILSMCPRSRQSWAVI